jgi:CsoR family transcriptional regulator, copper-sensing transcriptional repressor
MVVTPAAGPLPKYPIGVWYAGREPLEVENVHGYTADKDRYLARLRRIEGQVRGLQKMVEGDKYCIDILTQVSAVTSALQSVALGLLEDHLGHCVAQATAEGGDVAAAKVREASEAIARLVKS